MATETTAEMVEAAPQPQPQSQQPDNAAPGLPVPSLVAPNVKTLEATAAAMYKGGAAAALQNFVRMFQVNDWNVRRAQARLANAPGGAATADGGAVVGTDSVPAPLDPLESDMRVDSDNITYNVHVPPLDPTAAGQTPPVGFSLPPTGQQVPSSAGWDSLAKIARTVALATGIGAPAGLAIMNAPEIIRAINGVVESAPVEPASAPKPAPAGRVRFGGKSYHLRTGGDGG